MNIWWERIRDLLSLEAHSHAKLPDLRGLESEPSRLERTYYLVNDRQRQIQGERLYVLRREPRNRRHPSSIAAYARGRAVGYLSQDQSVRLAPLIDDLGGAALVAGTGSTTASIRLWVNVPTDAAVRGFVARPHRRHRAVSS